MKGLLEFMSNTTIRDIQTRFWRLYSEKAYAQALELVKEAMIQFPNNWRWYNWRMCMEARLNEPTQALQTLREAIDRGFWSDPAILRDDDDLQSLQGLAAFEQLLDECQQQFVEAQKTVKPEVVLLQPEQKATQSVPLAIALHGNTGNARNISQEWQSLGAKGWLVALAQSSQ